jgi:hypothetical protein
MYGAMCFVVQPLRPKGGSARSQQAGWVAVFALQTSLIAVQHKCTHRQRGDHGWWLACAQPAGTTRLHLPDMQCLVAALMHMHASPAARARE